jgi:hypothetical protein
MIAVAGTNQLRQRPPFSSKPGNVKNIVLQNSTALR